MLRNSGSWNRAMNSWRHGGKGGDSIFSPASVLVHLSNTEFIPSKAGAHARRQKAAGSMPRLAITAIALRLAAHGPEQPCARACVSGLAWDAEPTIMTPFCCALKDAADI